MPNNESFSERFRRVSAVAKSCDRKKTASFIANHESKTTIYVEQYDEYEQENVFKPIPAVVIMNNAEGADNSFTYVYKDEPLESGKYFYWIQDRELYEDEEQADEEGTKVFFFALERVKVIKEVDYKKFTALECNVKINDKVWAYFAGSKRSFKGTSLKDGSFEVANLQPVIVVPITNEIKINGYVTINNQVWRIVNADLDSVNGIGYYYVERDLNPRDFDKELEELENNDENILEAIHVGEQITVTTERGYINAEDIKIIKRSSNEVVFTPIKAGQLTVTVLRNSEYVELPFNVREV